MTVRATEDGLIVLSGVCPVDDAEPLLQLLLTQPGSIVEWGSCEEVHGAVVQVLLASDAGMRGDPRSRFLQCFVAPSLRRVDA